MKKLFNIIITFLILTTNFQFVFAVTNEEIREQSKILYLGKQYADANKHILQIPEKERTASDYFIIGATSSDEKTAIKAYEKAIALDKEFYQAYYNLGDICIKLQSYKKAIEYLKQAVKYKKDFEYGYYNLGCAYLKIDEYNLARKSFESAIKINREEPDYYYNLGYAYKKMGNTKRAEKAINLYNELIQKRNSN